MTEARELRADFNRLVRDAAVAHSGGGGNNEGMEPRIAKLEKDVGDIRVDVASIKSQLAAQLPALATTADMHKEFNVQTWRLIGGILAAAGLLLAGLRLLG